MEAFKLLLILAAIVVALRRKVPIGVTLFGAGLLTALIYQVPVDQLIDGYWGLVKSSRFISLTSLVILVTILGHLLKELGSLNRLAAACRDLPGGRRTAAVMLPTLVGLMPMPAGALLSAPLVDNVLVDRSMTPHFKCATNYWFRHLVEFCWPIYPGLILTEAITGMPVVKVALMQSPLTIMMLLIGFFFFARRIDRDSRQSESWWRSLLSIVGTIWPVLLAILIYGILKIDLALSLLAAVIVLVLIARPSKSALAAAVRKGLSYKLILLILGVLSFQMVLELSGAIDAIPKLATEYHLSDELVIFLACFAIGILTGMVSAFVGLGYSLLAGLLCQPSINPSYILLAYLSGFLGIMLSPSHLCLIFTNDFFGSDLLKVYRTFFWPLMVLGIAGYLLYLSGYGSLFLAVS